MSAEGKFLVYCIEIYRASKNMTGKQVIDLFTRYGALDYILSCYEALHTTGREYIVNDISLYICERQSASV